MSQIFWNLDKSWLKAIKDLIISDLNILSKSL